ncbi:proline--tRNA ligase [Candidatus Parcubacteria bacterium]|nr:MAG: proline--tRNA ligase [Candidatus Parcubacteria bacterium]
MSNKNNKICTRQEDYSQWYQDIIEAADLAEYGPVKGTMVIKPYGYAIWENIQKILDQKIKKTGHKNMYFPLLIPKSFLTKEASHVAGFAKECAVVTHYRLKSNDKGEIVVDEKAKLEEELIIRPTSETIINSVFSKWVSSWRDLPILINQWANVVRWEMRTRPFLRTSEFLWQEGHTAHATNKEAEKEARKMLKVYKDFVEKYLAMAVVAGEKSESEKFAGADRTYTIEAIMQDGKALQSATSHNLGQNFAKAFDIKYYDQNNAFQYVWQTSWGMSTRIIGGLIMTHSDDKGLVLPPNIAPIKVVVIPILKNKEDNTEVLNFVNKVKANLRGVGNFEIDERDNVTPGAKFNEWEKKGVPIRIEVGLRDIENNSVIMVRRDNSDKQSVGLKDLAKTVKENLKDIQDSLYKKAVDFRLKRTKIVDTWEEFVTEIENNNFVLAHWSGDKEDEEKIKAKTNATIRCLPFDQKKESGICVFSKKPSKQRVLFAKAY